MERVKLNDNLELSRIVYGMWRLGDGEDTSPSHVQEKVEACLEQGITSMDQADIYGDYGAEEIFGACLSLVPHLRDKLEIVTKCDIVAPCGRYADKRVKYYDTTPAHIEHSVEQSLKNMSIQHIDLLLIHRPDPFMNHMETGKALDNLVTSGKVKSVGVSNFKSHDWNLLQSAMSTKLATNQIEISVMDISAFSNGDLAFLQQNNIKPMAWSPLGGGSLFDTTNEKGARVLKALKEVADGQNLDVDVAAYAWLLKHPAGILPVVGTNNLERIKSLSNALKIEMDRETWFEVYTAALGHEVA